MTTITTNTNTGVVLGGTITNPVTVASGVTVAGTSFAISGSVTAWTVANNGVVSAGTHGAGITLAAGGAVSNAAGASVSGGSYGVAISGATGTVTNSGTILSGGSGFSAAAISLSGGGLVSNTASGVVGNSTVSGDGVVIGGVAGTVINDGSITGNNGVRLAAAASAVTNTAVGHIIGATGVRLSFHDTLVNAGVVTASFGFGAGGASPITVVNQAGGTITSVFGGVYGYGGSTVTNAGTIIAGVGRSAVYFAGTGSNLVIVDAGAVFTGTVAGSTRATNTLELASTSSAGTLSGFGTSFTHFGTLNVDAGAQWTLAAGNTLASSTVLTDAGTLTNSGSLGTTVTLGSGGVLTNASGGVISSGTATGVLGTQAGATLSNAGTIVASGTADGVLLQQGGTVTNAASASVSGGSYGVVVSGAAGTVTNSGTILTGGSGFSAAAISLGAGGLVSNTASGVVGNSTVSGNGVVIGGVAGTVINDGSITGNNGVLLRVAGSAVTNTASGHITGGVGVSLAVGDTLVNAGHVTATFGSGASGNSMTVVNQAGGTITGSVNGVYGYGGSTVTNAGTIVGGPGHAAVSFGGTGSNLLIVDAGAVFTGGAAGSTRATNTLELASTSSAGTLSGFGTSFTHFGTLNVDAGAQWTLAAGNTLASSTVLTDAGTLTNSGSLGTTVTLGSGGVLTNASGGVIAGATYGVFGSVTGTTVVNSGTISAFRGVAGTSVTVVNQVGGTISGSFNGVHGNDGSTVTNAGTIVGGSGQAAVDFVGTGSNLLIVDAGAVFTGIVAGSASATNTLELASTSSAGTLSGFGTSFTNFGAITVDTGAAWTLAGSNTLAAGATLTNQSTLTLAGTLVNGGTITGTNGDAGIDLASGGVLTNTASGVISSTNAGVLATQAGATLNNAGAISGSAGAGILFGQGGTVTNQAGGTIVGQTGIGIYGASGSVTNQGSIAGSDETIGVYLGGGGAVTNTGFITGGIGVLLSPGGTVSNSGTIIGTGGTAASFGGTGNNLVVIDPGAVFTGLVEGSASATNMLELASAGGAGTLSGLGSSFTHFGTITVDAGATWVLAADTLASAAAVIDGGTLTNHATLAAGVALGTSGGFTNASDGVVRSLGTAGVSSSLSSIAVANAGSISGARYGVRLVSDGGSLFNAAGGVITGGVSGVDIDAQLLPVTFVNDGLITGGTRGVALDALGGVTNDASGTISGTMGVHLASGGTIVNAGTISGTGGTAVYLGLGGSSLVVIDPGAVFVGTVVNGDNAAEIELASASSAGTISGLGTSYTNFTNVTVDAGAAWTLAGGNTLDAGSTLANSGTLTLQTATLADGGDGVNDGAVLLGSSTLAVQDLTGTGSVAIGAGSTLAVAGTLSAGQTVSFTGGGNAMLSLGFARDVAGTIAGFAVGDTIDVTDLAFVSGVTTASVAGNVLTASSSGPSVTFATSGLANGAALVVSADGHGGTDIVFSPVAAPAGLTLAPASDSGMPGDLSTDIATPVITGTGVTGDTITLYDGTVDVGSAVVVGGAWSITTSTLAAGSHTLTATQTDTLGEVSSASGSLALSIVAAPDAPAGLTLAPASDSGTPSDNSTDITTPAITGTGVTGDTVTLYDGTVEIGSTVVANGAWSITGTLAAGGHVLTATQTDTLGDVSGVSGSLDLGIVAAPGAPAGLTLAPSSDSGVGSDGTTDIATPVLTGTGVTGDTITLYDGTVDVGSAVVAGGAWSITTSTLAAGSHTLTATQTDTLGDVSATSGSLALSIVAAPAAPAGLTLAPASDSGTPSDNSTDITTPAITGTGATGDTVTLYDGTVDIGSAVVVGGAWSITSSTLAAGSHVLTATQTDTLGDFSAASGALDLSIVAAATAPAGLTLAPSSDSGIPGDRSTDVATPAITGTGATGDTITLYDGTVDVGSAVVADGAWSITGTLAVGSHTLTATQTDTLGNVSAVSGALDLSIVAAPSAPAGLTLAPASDSGVAGDHSTAITTPAITGTGVTGDTVTLHDGTVDLGSAVVSNGAWSITSLTLAAGSHTLTATQTDALGDVSATSGSLALSIVAAPAAPAGLTLAPASDSGTAGDDITNHVTPRITGTGVSGDTVALYDGTTEIGSAVVVDGAWAITTSTLADGTHALRATQTDTLGDVSAVSTSLGLTIDTVGPTAAPTLNDPSASTTPAEPVITGSAEPGSLVTLYSDGVLAGTARADGAGAWRYAFTTPLSVGSHLLTATDGDAAGNASVLSPPLTVQVAASGAYTAVLPPGPSGDVVSRMHDSTGLLTQVDTTNADGRLLQSVSTTQAVLDIYDSSGKLIGTIAQPSNSASNQPNFSTSGQTLAAATDSGTVGSVIDLLAESNVINSAGPDTINAGPGADTIFAVGATSFVAGGSGSLLYAAGPGVATTITGGSGSSSVYGGGGGGVIEGGSAGHNVLVAGGGGTLLQAGGAGDLLVGGSGPSSVFGATGATLAGGAGSAVLAAGAGPEQLWGGAGGGQLFGGTGDDLMDGGTGASTMVGGSGNTVFVDGGGPTEMWGGAGNDVFFGLTGADLVVERSGNDEVQMGRGTMSVFGGTGTDLYDVTRGFADGGTEAIYGFKVGTDQLRFFGEADNGVQQQVVGGSTVLTLNDGATITLVGVSHLAPGSVGSF